VLLTAAAFVVAAFGYGLLMRWDDEPATAEDETSAEGDKTLGLRLWLASGLVALLSGLGLSAPFLLAREGIGHPAQLAGFLVPCLATVAMVFLPLATLATFDRSGPRVLANVLRWRRWSLLLAVAILPVGLVLVECALVFATFFLGIFGGLMIELIPAPDGLRDRLGVQKDWIFKFGEPCDVRFLHLYGNRLGHGYTLTGAVPPSLMLPEDLKVQYWASNLLEHSYFMARTGLTLFIMTGLLSALALQARCLGRIARLECRTTAKRAPPNPTA